MKGFHRRQTAIGIDVGARSIRAVQLEARRGRYKATAIAMMSRMEVGQALRDEELQELRRVLKRQGFRGRDTIVAVPDEPLLHGAVELPRQVSGQTVAQITRMELARMHRRVPDSFEMICWEPVTGQAQSATQAIAIACPHEIANELLDTFQNNGFNVEALDARPVAALRACTPLIPAPPAITALLDLEWGTTQLQLTQGTTVVYERLLSGRCFGDLVSHLGEKFDLLASSVYQLLNTAGLSGPPGVESLDEKSLAVIRGLARGHFDMIMQDLRVPFEYVAHHYPPDGVKRMLLIGEGATLPGLSQYLQAALGVEVLTASPANTVDCGPHLSAKVNNPAITVALGLARFVGA